AAIDPTTGTLKLEADFPNPESLVLAGQFARVRASVETLKDALLVPQRAIMELQGEFQVMVVGSDEIIEVRKVTTGPIHNNLRVIQEGL
ncbi:MAG: efflux transporter periplasmic adaptor subunit, partial [Aliifodinibius sp.]|nr:efflux transporter periplasmic adaptor subunit [Fodinibius sp.]NIY29424.1 efflux transporter periplasmic adaptor subunit [Fodinibius sp.]